jgi:Trk-type K+ transport system membrane component
MGLVDFESMSTGSDVVHLIAAWFGSIPVVMLVPVVLKARYLRVNFPRLVGSRCSRTSKQKFKNIQHEYRALVALIYVVVGLFLTILVLGFVALAIYANCKTWVAEELRQRGANPTFWALFHVTGSLLQMGLPFFKDGLIWVNSDAMVCLVLPLVMAMSNTALPIVLRFVVWLLHKITKRPEFKFLLVYPRECCTLLFPPVQTRVLIIMWLGMVTLQITTMVGLCHNFPVMAGKNGGQMLLTALLEAFNERATGFPAVDHTGSHPAFVWLVVFYMSASTYPFILSLQETASKNELFTWRKLYAEDIKREEVPRNADGRRSMDIARPASVALPTRMSFDARRPPSSRLSRSLTGIPNHAPGSIRIPRV